MKMIAREADLLKYKLKKVRIFDQKIIEVAIALYQIKFTLSKKCPKVTFWVEKNFFGLGHGNKWAFVRGP